VSHDISTTRAGLVVAIGVKDELAEERAVGRDDPAVGLGDEQPDRPAGMRPA
jgi:hypothetical protein